MCVPKLAQRIRPLLLDKHLLHLELELALGNIGVCGLELSKSALKFDRLVDELDEQGQRVCWDGAGLAVRRVLLVLGLARV